MKIVFPLLMFTLLAACDTWRDNRVSTYASKPEKVIVHVDEATVYVVRDGGDEYVAWGGPVLKEKSYSSYRRMRAIEVTSGCRVGKVMSQNAGEVLRASVNC